MQDAPDLEDSYLRNWFADVRSTTSRAESLFSEFSDEQKLWKPTAKVWSVAECFDHLAITAGLYLPGLEAAIHQAPAADSERPFKARWLHGKFIAAIGPQSRRKVKTFKIFEGTQANLDLARIEKEFLGSQSKLADLIRRVDGHDLNAGKIYSPVSKLLSFTLGEVIWLLTAHAERHLQQARNLTAHTDFPGGD